ncbi:hypothetical protein SAMN04488156_102616 [Bacillus sp. 166amftsu]|nr:hypothetical protein SAMN04488156_102616 [Bacillus sp. 166amftsu]
MNPKSFTILFKLTVNMAITLCNSIPIRPEDEATSYPCYPQKSLFLLTPLMALATPIAMRLMQLQLKRLNVSSVNFYFGGLFF